MATSTPSSFPAWPESSASPLGPDPSTVPGRRTRPEERYFPSFPPAAPSPAPGVARRGSTPGASVTHPMVLLGAPLADLDVVHPPHGFPLPAVPADPEVFPVPEHLRHSSVVLSRRGPWGQLRRCHPGTFGLMWVRPGDHADLNDGAAVGEGDGADEIMDEVGVIQALLPRRQLPPTSATAAPQRPLGAGGGVLSNTRTEKHQAYSSNSGTE